MEITFVLKKIISAFIMPLSLGLFLLICGIYFVYKNCLTKGKIFLILGLLWIIIISHSSFANLLLAPLENSYPKLTHVSKDIQYIVYLGGDQENRGWEVLRLYTILDNAKIITSGYEGRGEIPEAIKTADILKNIGIPQNDIIIHPTPKDTKEEAKKIKEVLKDNRFILVTSAYHMKRAMMLFEQVGLNPIPAPTDFQIKESDKFISMPDGYNLKKTERAWHEYLGIFWMRMVRFW